MCQSIFQKSIKKLTKVCLLTHFCYFVAVIFGIILVQNVSKNWQIMRCIVGSILPLLTHFWYISAYSPSTYKLQKLSKMCQTRVSTLQKCIKKVTKVCLLTHFCHIFGYLGWRMTLSNLSPHTKFVHKYIQWTKLWTDFGHDPIKYLGDDHESLGQNIALRFYSIPYQWI